MKLNNKGFAISTIMYMILIMAVILITLTLTLLSSRKLILDKTKEEAKSDIYTILPNDYQEVEYIQSTGTQYINTNFYPSKETEIYFDFEYLSGNEDGPYVPLLGQRTYENSTGKSMFAIWVCSLNGGISINFGSVDTVNTNEGSSTDCSNIIQGTNGIGRHIYKNVGSKFYMDNNQIIDVSSSNFEVAATNTLIIFGIKTGSTVDVRGLNGRLYSLEIYESKELVRNFIPCYRKSDNVIGLYDAVNKTFYINNGTGAFLKGNNINH